MRLRARNLSTSQIPGNWPNCAKKGTAASRPIIALLAPRWSASAGRITPVVRAAVVFEKAASTTNWRSPASRRSKVTWASGESIDHDPSTVRPETIGPAH